MQYSLKRSAIALVLVGLLIGSCNLPGAGAPPSGQPGQAPTVEGAAQPAGQAPVQEQPAAAPTQPPTPTVEPTPTPIPSEPVSIQKGLNGLDSYRITIQTRIAGNDPNDRTEVTSTVQRDNKLKASHTLTTSLNSTKDEPSNKPSTSESYTVGNDTCQKDEEGWKKETTTAQKKEMQDALSRMIDFVPLIDNPEFVAAETVNNIPSHHFKFRVADVGVTSGTIATVNTGEYWLAVDGRYIVKYSLDLETRSGPTTDPKAEVAGLSVHIELTDVNQPITIQLPPDCK
ncbi:MAG TPA: hypothetical protein VMT46_06705 [Anaerolineaceae bacterium]|nr:hypothetical protein [Anaerolineaceae bacterium]